MTFLLRSPSVFDADNVIQGYVESGKARLVKGDALVLQDVRRAWKDAAKGEGQYIVDLLVFTVGQFFKASSAYARFSYYPTQVRYRNSTLPKASSSIPLISSPKPSSTSFVRCLVQMISLRLRSSLSRLWVSAALPMRASHSS